MKLIHAMSGLVVVGVCLVVLSFFWQGIVGGRTAWSDEKAQKHADLSAKLHAKRGEGHHAAEQAAVEAKRSGSAAKHPVEKEPEKSGSSLEEYKERFAQSSVELQRAQNRGQTTALVFRWLGAVCTVIGGAGYFVLRNREI